MLGFQCRQRFFWTSSMAGSGVPVMWWTVFTTCLLGCFLSHSHKHSPGRLKTGGPSSVSSGRRGTGPRTQLVIWLSSLRCMAGTTPSSWSNHLPGVEYAHNTLICSATELSPFEASVGYQPPLLFFQMARETWRATRSALYTRVWPTATANQPPPINFDSWSGCPPGLSH